MMRKPEITKKTSTPTKPPANRCTPAWAMITRTTARARSPWMSGRNPVVPDCSLAAGRTPVIGRSLDTGPRCGVEVVGELLHERCDLGLVLLGDRQEQLLHE